MKKGYKEALCLVLIVACIATITQSLKATPGISMSLDYTDFRTTMKEPILKSLLSVINDLPLPPINQNGVSLEGIKLFVDQKADNLRFDPIETQNAVFFEIKNLYARVRVNKFKYTLLIMPLEGFLEVELGDVLFNLKIAVEKRMKNGRLLPYLNVHSVNFKINMNKVKFDLGGDPLLHIADVIIPIFQGALKAPVEKLVLDAVKNGFPKKVNTFIQDSDGQFNFGEQLFPGTNFSSLTLDYQLDDDLKIRSNRIEIGLNGTIWNKDKGYKVVQVTQPEMPMYDPNLKSKMQVFISNYFLEQTARAFLEKQPFKYNMPAWNFNNSVAPFETTTFEGIFPFMSSRYGKRNPTDLLFSIFKVYDIKCQDGNSDNPNDRSGFIEAKMYIEAEAKLQYQKNNNYSIGHAEFHDTKLKVQIKQKSDTQLNLFLISGNVSEQWVDTNYIGRFKSSPFVINTAIKYLMQWLNKDVLGNNRTLDIQALTMGYVKVEDFHLGYHDGYLSGGFTANFTNSKLIKRVAAPLLGEYVRKVESEWVHPPPIPEHLVEHMIEVNRLIGEGFRDGYIKKLTAPPEISYELSEAEESQNFEVINE